MKNSLEFYMQKAIVLAKKGFPEALPNPLVGAVLVKNNEIIGQGYHAQFGEAHAEEMAILDAEARGFLLNGASLFVTLEPCHHLGKRPACSQLILDKKIKRLIIGNQDPNPEAAGGGEFLKRNAVEVITGVCAEKTEKLNKGFFWAHKNQLPFVTAKIAMSKNGFITEKGEETPITGKKIKYLTHTLRAHHDAILIGKNTALIDRPKLTPYLIPGAPEPVKIIFDRKLESQNVINGERIIFVTDEKINTDKKTMLVKNKNGFFDLHDFAHQAYIQGIKSILLEGGSSTLNSFLQSDLIQQLIIFESSKIIDPKLGLLAFENGFPNKFSLKKSLKFGEDIAKFYSLN